MKERIETFCEDIKLDYWRYMYEDEYVGFPKCCRASALVITAFLQDCTNEICKCFFSNYSLHGYTIIGNNEYVIDFTDFQFPPILGEKLPIDEIKEHKYKTEDMLKLIKQQKVILSYNEGNYGLHDTGREIDLSDFFVIRKRRSLCKADFFCFLDEVWKDISRIEDLYSIR